MSSNVTLEKREFFYLSGLFVYMICMLLMLTVAGENIQLYNPQALKILKMIRYLAYFIVAIKLLGEQYAKRNIWRMFLLVAILMLNVIATGDKVGVFFAYFIIMAKEINIDKILRITMVAQIITLIVTIGCCYLGILPDYVFTEGGRIRHSLGFTWTTTPTILFFFVTLEYIYLRRELICVAEYLLLLIINSFFYFQTKTRVTYALVCVIIAFFFFYQRMKWLQMLIDRMKGIFVLAPTFLCIFSVMIHCKFQESSKIWHALNEFMNNRLKLGYQAYIKYGIPLWGQPIEWIGNSYHKKVNLDYNYVDCSYMQIILQDGIVFLVLIIAVYTFMIWHTVKKNNLYYCGMLLFILIFSVTEPRLYNVAFNPFPLYAGIYFAVSNKNEKV